MVKLWSNFTKLKKIKKSFIFLRNDYIKKCDMDDKIYLNIYT